MNDSNYTVYMHISPSGKRYIGITKHNVEKRWKRGYAHNPYFSNAIQKYGWDNIEHIIVAENLSQDEACKMEIDLIDKYKSNQHDYGYNCSSGGECSGAGVKHIVSDETRKRLSESHMGLQSGMLGKHHSEETKQKISNSKKGKVIISDEQRKKISKANKGRKMSDDFGEKVSKALKGRKLSDEHKKKLSEAEKGKPSNRKGAHLTEEQKQHLREVAKANYKPLTEEQRQKISEANKRRWEKYRLEHRQ